jgi:hypothetical protein
MKCAPTGLSWASATRILDSWEFHAQQLVGDVIDLVSGKERIVVKMVMRVLVLELRQFDRS